MTQHLSGFKQLSLSQRQLHVWQAQQLDPNNPVYNIACALSFSGDIHRDTFDNALALLNERHPLIHSAIQQAQDKPYLNFSI